MYKLYSERIKNKDGESEVYIYDEFPEAFRNQFFYMMTDVLDELNHCCCRWNDIHDHFCREKGSKLLGDWDRDFREYGRHICNKKGYMYDKAKDTAKTLISILENNNFYPSHMSAHMTSLRTTLETGLPVVRNKNAGHGQGSTVTPISDEFAEYTLNLDAINVVLLVGICKRGKSSI